MAKSFVQLLSAIRLFYMSMLRNCPQFFQTLYTRFNTNTSSKLKLYQTKRKNKNVKSRKK